MTTAPKPHISTYTPTPGGGHARYTHELLSALAEQGAPRDIDVSLVTSVNLEPAFRTLAYPVHAILPALRPRAQFRNPVSWAISRLLFYGNRDGTFVRWVEGNDTVTGVHIHEYTPWLAMFHYPRLRKRGIKVMETVHNIRWNYVPPGLPKWLPNVCNRRAWQSCDALFVHTPALKQELADFLGPQHPPIFVTPHGVWANPGADPPPTSAQRLARRRLIFFGVINEYKGVHILLEAIEHLPDVTLVIAGAATDAAYRRRLEEMIAGLPNGQVTLIDRFIEDDELPALFAEGTLVVLPYVTFSAQSGVLHDALSWGLPVVGTDVGAVGESIREWNIGEVAPAGDAVALAQSIRRMLRPQAHGEAMSAIERVKSDLGWDKSASTILDAYEAVMHVER